MHSRAGCGSTESCSVDASAQAIATGTTGQLELPHVVTISRAGSVEMSTTALVTPSESAGSGGCQSVKRSMAIDAEPSEPAGGVVPSEDAAHAPSSTSTDGTASRAVVRKRPRTSQPFGAEPSYPPSMAQACSAPDR